MAKGLLATQEAEYRRLAALRSAEASHREQRALREAAFAEPETYDAHMQFSMGRPYTYGYERKMGVKPGLINHSTPQQPRLSGMQQMNGLPQALVQSSHSGLMNIPQPTPLVDSGKGMEHSDFLQKVQNYENLRGGQQITASPPAKPIAIKPEAAFRQSLPGVIPRPVSDGLMNAPQPTPVNNAVQDNPDVQGEPQDFIEWLKKAEGDTLAVHGFVVDPRSDGTLQINYGHGVEADDEVIGIVGAMVENGTPTAQIKDVILRHGANQRRQSAKKQFNKSIAGEQIEFDQQPQGVQDLLTELEFNTRNGIAGWPTLVKAAKSGDYSKVREEMFLDENKNAKKGEKNAGAVRRNLLREEQFTPANLGMPPSSSAQVPTFNPEPSALDRLLQKFGQNVENTNTNKTP